MGAHNLWEKVELVRKWDLGGVGMEGVGVVGPPLLVKVLKVAKEVTFSSAFDHAEDHIMWAGGVWNPTLSSLESGLHSHPFPHISRVFFSSPKVAGGQMRTERG